MSDFECIVAMYAFGKALLDMQSTCDVEKLKNTILDHVTF